MKLQTKLIVQSTSPQWTSAINRFFPDSKITWVLNADQLEELAFEEQGGAIVVEFTEETMLDLCTKVSLIGNNSRHWLMMAIGQPESTTGQNRNVHPSIRNRIQRLGFTFWATSLLEMPELRNIFLRHAPTVPPFSGSIEERIQLTLPWTTASND